LGLQGGAMFAYEKTGGSNLDLPAKAWTPEGREVDFIEDICRQHDIVLCVSTFSATAPLTAWAKEYGFRGATMHGMNDTILRSGLAVDYDDVSRDAEKLRLGLAGEEAQKAHGLCRGGPDVANLPAGEIYYVPAGAEGRFPMRYEDGTIGLMHVTGGRIVRAEPLRGDVLTIAAHNAKLQS